MRASLIIASHNEGQTLGKTIESCLETSANLDYEIVLADDASTDGSVEEAAQRFPQVRLQRHERRQGASPTKALGAQNARGEVLIFLDGHTKPEYGAIPRLVRDVEQSDGTAIITPAVAALDAQRWQNNHAQIGNGYALNLRTFECGWQPLSEMRPVVEGRTQFYESGALIGCVLAISRELYDKLWGFDAHMRSWGVEDLDLGLKCWLMGYRILHDPQAVVGHRFRASFDNYPVPVEHVVMNQLRMARKNFTHGVWAEWLEGCRQRYPGRLGEHPEGLWAHVWHLLNAERASVEQERWYLHARRPRDEFWYAERFGQNWPRLQAAAEALRPLVFAPSPSPSPSPPPGCRFQVLGPADVPGLSSYKYTINVPAGKTPTNIQWTADKPSASFVGATNQIDATVQFKNTTADWINLKATFTLDGNAECAQKQIALVKVDVGTAHFTNPGRPSGTSTGTKVVLVNPPPPPAVPTWVTTHDPGSACAAFTYNGSSQAAEARQFVASNGTGGGSALHAETTVTLTSPPEKPAALQQIQVGYIQHGSDSGSATYATTPPGKIRTVTIPTSTTVDWLTTPCSPGGTDEWPWYDTGSRATGSGTGSWSQLLTLDDSPGLSIPAQYNPNNAGDPNATKGITTASETFGFAIRIAARTMESDSQANQHFFDQGHSTWSVAFAWPVVPGASIVTTGPDWTKPASATEVSINVVPTSTNHNAPFLRWIPS